MLRPKWKDLGNVCSQRPYIFLGIKHELQLQHVKEQGAEEKKGPVMSRLHMQAVEFCRNIWSVDQAYEKEKYLLHSTCY